MPRDTKKLKNKIDQLNNGEITDPQEALEIVADAIYTGHAWSSGMMLYQMAEKLISEKKIDRSGNIIKPEREKDDHVSQE